MRGSRPKSMVTAADSSHLKAGCAANDAVFRTVDAALQHGRKHQRTLSPAFKHSKAAIHVPPRTAHRIKHIVDKVSLPVSVVDSVALGLRNVFNDID